MQHRREVASGFLQRLNDPGDRLRGENPATATLDDSRRWAATYDKLIALKQAEPEVARAIRETDVIRDFWKIRATELAGNGRRGGKN